MATINERAKEYAQTKNPDGNQEELIEGYKKGARDQRELDIEKAIDARCKCCFFYEDGKTVYCGTCEDCEKVRRIMMEG